MDESKKRLQYSFQKLNASVCRQYRFDKKHQYKSKGKFYQICERIIKDGASNKYTHYNFEWVR